MTTPDISIAARDVLAERERQKAVEGWTSDHDDNHRDGSLACAAASYALNASVESYSPTRSPSGWPPVWSYAWWKPTSRRRDLVKAGALILAEIERLDRMSDPVQP